MKEWLSATEIEAYNLPDIPKTSSAILRFAKRKDWAAAVSQKGKPLARQRAGRGGGLEYHYTILPAAARSTYTIRHLQSADAPPIDELFKGANTIPEPPTTLTAELRRDAILLILNFWDIYRVKASSTLEAARFEFVTMYQNDKISGIPAWVTAALTSQNGNKKKLCVNTLRRWEYTRNKSEFNSLAGKHGNRKGTGKLASAEGGKVETFIAARIVHQPHLTADHIRDLVTAEFGNTLNIGGKACQMPPIRTFQRFISKWKSEHQEALAKMTDPDAYKSKVKFSGTNMNHWVRRPNQLWEIDASPADVLLTDGRYSIYALVDIYTRRMLVTVSKTPKTEAVLGLLRIGIKAWGVPENLRTDNGSDFISHQFKRALSALAIHQDITDPFSPEQKGTVERHIGTLQRGFMTLLPGFVGHNVTDRKKIEARRSFAKRLGESDQNAFCVDLTPEDLQERTDRWIEAKYNHKPHAGLKGKSPFEMIAAWTGPIRQIEDERALDILLSPLAGTDGFRQVTKFGITLDRAKFIHGNLVPGTRVFVRVDPQDMGRIYVYEADGHEFICVAECPERLGKNPGDAVRAARAEQARRVAEEVDPLQRQIRNIKPRDMIDAVIDVNEQKTANLAAFPKQTETYTSPELDTAAKVIASESDEVKSAPLTVAQESVRKDVVADLEAFRKPKTEMERKRENYQRALDLEEQIAAERTVDVDDVLWLGRYQGSAEYRAMKSISENFAANQA